ncbi:hypothetical protein HPP92_000399 [Vanilla planifolia]|uniref:CW-type domain-containing protein n=1 Tax=Vanilla planifolia TaxID=51239 RepID=A0A835S182_VANPL|nr:hypothetical protein HPP92_000399 [Vanilla planifolia]
MWKVYPFLQKRRIQKLTKLVTFQVARQATDVQQSMNGAAPKSDAASAIPALVLIQDNWVCCDECQRWRLLPYGTNPDSLPKKWRCGMQTWLPGLNNCNISEDETTKVFHELYQVPAPVSGTNLTSHLDAATSSITSAGPSNPVRRLENDMNNASLTGNRKLGFISGTELLNDSSSTHFLNPSKMVQASSQNKVFNDVGYYLTESDSKAMTSKDGGAEEKYMNKQREKLKNMSSYKDGGDVAAKPNKPSKPSSKRDINVDGHGSSKKFKKDGSHHSLKDLHSVTDTSGKMAVNSDSNVSEKAPKHVIQSYSDHSSSKDFKSKSASSKMSREQAKFPGKHKELSSSSHAEKLDGYDSNGKKRKLKGWEEKQAFQEISMSSEPVMDTNPMIKEDLVPGVFRKQKKAKVAKSDGKGSRVLIGSEKVETKDRLAGSTISANRKRMVDVIDSGVVRSTTEEPMVLYQGNANLGQALDCVDGVKRNMNYVRPFAAATSSSSKVSGSQKSKSNFPEVRGSPVESVSSSPMRISNTENISKQRNSLMNDNTISTGPPETWGQKQFSDGEVYGTDQMKSRTMDPASTVSLKSSDVYQSADCRVLSSLKEPHDYLDTETNCLSRVKGIDGRMVKNVVVVSTDIDEGNILQGSDKNHASGDGKDSASGQNKLIKSSCIKLKSGILDTDADKGKLKVFASSKHNELHPLQRTKGHQADYEFDHCNLNIKDDLENHSKQQEDHDSRFVIAAPGQSKMSQLENLQHESSHGRQKSPGALIAEEIGRPEMDSGTATQPSHPLKDKLGKRGPGPQRVPESNKVSSNEQYPVDAVNSETLKLSKQSRKLDGQNGTHPNVLRQLNISVPGSSSPMKRDGHPSVNSLIKEARELKHKATRLKSIGLDDESSSILFESALKFLYAASLMEPTEAESLRQVDLLPSSQMLQMYCETAKFFEFCAHDYERLKKMAAAALAYKCAEVAYFKVAYYKNGSASKDRVELQGALDAAVPGESPSSSASDVDNLNNQGGFDKAASAKAASSPQIAGGHAIAAKNRPYVMRLLTFTNHVNCAIEATRKSRNAIAASNVDLGKDGMCSVRKVLDFNFHNVEGLLRLVRQSLNSIGQ